MILTENNIFYYLLDRGLIDTKAVIDGEFSVRQINSRNHNFIINREFDAYPYFIKQVRAFDREKIETLHIEATCYRLANSDIRYKCLKEFLPDYYHYDDLNHVLIVEQIKNTISLNDFYFQLNQFTNTIPELLAQILASYHTSINTATIDQAHFQYFRKQQPWIFTITGAPAKQWVNKLNGAEQQTMQLILKNEEFVSLLQTVTLEWQSSTLIHNDIKFNNILIRYDAENNKVNFLKLIDWEIADVGDPLWDVAAVLQNYLLLWISTDTPEQYAQPKHLNKISIKQAQLCIRQFWKSYIQQMGFSSEQENKMLIKAVKFCAFKLINTSFETATHSDTLQPLNVKLLQMSLNILRAPADATANLFGIN